MRTEVDHHSLLATAEDHAVSKGRHARADFDGPATSIVHDSVVEGPARRVPGPAGNGTVDERCPEEDEYHHRHKAPAFGNGTCNNGSGGSTELHLMKCQLSKVFLVIQLNKA